MNKLSSRGQTGIPLPRPTGYSRDKRSSNPNPRPTDTSIVGTVPRTAAEMEPMGTSVFNPGKKVRAENYVLGKADLNKGRSFA